MAERLRKLHQEDVRAKIQTSQIINRLVDHGFGKVELSTSQVNALKIVLGKALPDLSQVEMQTTTVPYDGYDDDALYSEFADIAARIAAGSGKARSRDRAAQQAARIPAKPH
jgi:hypothetical protein